MFELKTKRAPDDSGALSLLERYPKHYRVGRGCGPGGMSCGSFMGGDTGFSLPGGGGTSRGPRSGTSIGSFTGRSVGIGRLGGGGGSSIPL
jgi:hypothetical protein